ncbi:MAG: hypothetical protein RSF67_00405 [Clostridia bacterium]
MGFNYLNNMENKRLVEKRDDLMTFEDWSECVESGGFIDYDGSGFWSDGKYVYEDEDLYPSDIEDLIKNQKHTHVVWFNR